MAILTLKVVNLTYYNLKGGQFKVILTLKVVIFDLKAIKNGFGISDLISDFGISDFKIISDFGFGISDLPKYFSFYAILRVCIYVFYKILYNRQKMILYNTLLLFNKTIINS